MSNNRGELTNSENLSKVTGAENSKPVPPQQAL